ncbi:MAG: NADH-quinone oxidoreductase subunit A [Candidatus Methanospirareceae archaeon]
MMIENVVVIAALIAICLIVDGVLLIIVRILPRYSPTDVKMSRFEAGNIPIRYPKYTLPMQYFGFMFMFMAAEPVVVLLLILSAFPNLNFFIILSLSLLLLLPGIYVGYKIVK